jgi:molybdopterin-binding protein
VIAILEYKLEGSRGPSGSSVNQNIGGCAMKLSTRNVIKGKVVEVKEGAVAAKVKVDIGGGNVLTSTITVDAVKDLALKTGDEVFALIKASNIMIMKD